MFEVHRVQVSGVVVVIDDEDQTAVPAGMPARNIPSGHGDSIEATSTHQPRLTLLRAARRSRSRQASPGTAVGFERGEPLVDPWCEEDATGDVTKSHAEGPGRRGAVGLIPAFLLKTFPCRKDERSK